MAKTHTATPSTLLSDKYSFFTESMKNNLGFNEVASILKDLYQYSYSLINDLEKVELNNELNKRYYALQDNNRLTRAINSGLFIDDPERITAFIEASPSMDFEGYTSEELNRLCYSLAMTVCAAMDIHFSGAQKRVGTFFEYLIGFFASIRFGTSPVKEQKIPIRDDEFGLLPTDYIFTLGDQKIHLPVKTSTRERAVQVWAHQKILNNIWGLNSYLGMLVGLAETKVDKKKLIVTDICVPEQWKLYQSRLAYMDVIYYLDTPERYDQLNGQGFKILPFGNFLKYGLS